MLKIGQNWAKLQIIPPMLNKDRHHCFHQLQTENINNKETENSQRSNSEGEDIEMENNGYIGIFKNPSYMKREKRFNLP